ncbi:elongation factor-like GTPase 1 [Strongylocentrotus purpuratus]|uniref:Elongation factor-like 1 n=1 Tax=Strongylocentrotus purpuratus TaxID=7668 RepID=A0A7M7N7V2_STRPU|nr:elongation factor-like GTPase 1 [Strongylocentrotus purpuratus]
MRSVSVQKLTQLQSNVDKIRNICILAHVDHGKTTLADALISSNGIISTRMAGKLRYMDSREDEQLRGITMKSSAISLLYSNTPEEEYLVNLIDSPGHVDFSSEVSTAVRLCEGALVVIDVVEGVCPQTHVVLRQAWLEHIKPCLVLNKIDRLISELKYTPMEAHLHLQQVLEQVNAVVGNLYASHVLEKTSSKTEDSVQTKEEVSGGDAKEGEEQVYDWSDGLEDTDDSHIYFSPDQGNVIFASALDGWGFSINHFAEMYASKLGVRADVLRKTLWGDFYLHTKSKRIMKGAQAKAKKPLFVQFVLENIWSLYETVIVRKDKEKMEKIVKSLGLKLTPRDLRHNDTKICLQAICNQWLPVSKAVLSMICSKLPSPTDVSEERIEKLMCSSGQRFDSLHPDSQQLKQAFQKSTSDDDAPVIVYISKMVVVDSSMLPQNRQRPLTSAEIQQRRDEARRRHAERQAAAEQEKEGGGGGGGKKDDNATSKVETSAPEMPEPIDLKVESEEKEEKKTGEMFLAFARVFSGTIRKGQKLFVLGPRHDPQKALAEMSENGGTLSNSMECSRYIAEFTVDSLYLLMGRELELLEKVPAGNILGIGGLDEMVLKSATVSSSLACPAFTDMTFAAPPIVRVAVEPKHLSDMQALMKGMKLLNQADPCVEVFVQETGEHVIVAAGEVHLERCLDDLRKRFAKVEIDVSPPIIPFRETIIPRPKMDMVNEVIDDINQVHRKIQSMGIDTDDIRILKNGLVEIKTSNDACTFHIRAVPLPEAVTSLLEENAELIRLLDHHISSLLSGKASDQASSTELAPTVKASMQELKSKLEEAFNAAGKKWRGCLDGIWAFGPRRCGPNILVNKIEDYKRLCVWDCLEKGGLKEECVLREFDNSIGSGFQLATLAGPICEEPMMGVCFLIEKWEMDQSLMNKGLVDKANLRTTKKHDVDVVSAGYGADVRESTEKDGSTESRLDDNKDTQCNSSSKMASQPRTISIPKGIPTGGVNNPEETRIGSLTCTSPLSSPILSFSPLGSPPAFGSPLPHSPLRGFHPYHMQQQVVYGPLSGQVISTIKEGCRVAFQTQPQRLMAAMYKCDIQATADVLGRMYGVVSKRNGRILQEEMREGSDVFEIAAVLPVAESFGFSEDIRKKTSGLASPQLFFSHWEVVPGDPYWEPSTEEELLHFGEKADYENQAKKYMNGVRRRKGLRVEEKIVEHAEKQRTLSKNK